MSESIAPILIVFGLVYTGVLVWLIVLVLNLKKKLKSFMAGTDGASLEGVLANLAERSAMLESTMHSHKEALEFLDGRIKRSIRGYSLIRYNAYPDAGGEQSFASGLLDEHGDGYVLSVISNRNHVGVYAKKVIGGKADVSLTEEEQQALEEAKQAIK